MRRLTCTAAALGVAATTLLAPTAAHAAIPDRERSTYYTGVIRYGDGDPVPAGCQADARTVAWDSSPWGTMELRWSDRCSANWARYTAQPGYTYWYVRTDVSTDDLSRWAAEGHYWNQSQYSNMIRIPTWQRACAEATVKVSVNEVHRLKACA